MKKYSEISREEVLGIVEANMYSHSSCDQFPAMECDLSDIWEVLMYLVDQINLLSIVEKQENHKKEGVE